MGKWIFFSMLITKTHLLLTVFPKHHDGIVCNERRLQQQTTEQPTRTHTIYLNSSAPGRCYSNFKSDNFANSPYRIVAWALTVKLLSGECHRTSLIRSQYWFKSWLHAARQQAITWANADLVLDPHIASLRHNESIHTIKPGQKFCHFPYTKFKIISYG